LRRSFSTSISHARITAEGIRVVNQRQQQVLQRGVFVVPLVGEREGSVERLLWTA
jgi:hypothetical protein